jgi:hypothetical protein
MTCEEFEQILLDSQHRVSSDGWMLRASRAALVQQHVNHCSLCAARMVETTGLEDALDQFRLSTQHLEAPVSVEDKLLDMFREKAATRQSRRGFVFPGKLVWVSMAAVVLVVAGILLRSKLTPGSVLPDQTSNRGSKGGIPPRPLPDISGAPPASDHSRNPSKENPRTILKRRFAEAHARTTEPGRAPAIVQASDVLSLNGGGSVVRVTLPVSSLIAMGVPVRPDLSESRVTADVWMDPFGAVVGVRLVPASASAD